MGDRLGGHQPACWRETWAALRCGDTDPRKCGSPDAWSWENPEESALEYAADQFLQAAQAARKRLDEHVGRAILSLLNSKGDAA